MVSIFKYICIIVVNVFKDNMMKDRFDKNLNLMLICYNCSTIRISGINLNKKTGYVL